MEKRYDLPLDSNASRRKFKELLNRPIVFFVVLGNTASASALVEDAVTQAGEDSDPIAVVWAKNHQSIAAEVGTLAGLRPDMTTPDQAFTVSSRKVTCVIRANEGSPDLVRIFSCIMTGLQDGGA